MKSLCTRSFLSLVAVIDAAHKKPLNESDNKRSEVCQEIEEA